MRRIIRIGVLVIVGVWMALATTPIAEAGGWYLRPRLGVTVNVDDNDAFFAAGGGLGYRWSTFFSGELAYTHLFGDDDAEQIDFSFRGGLPLGFLYPYGIIGGGIFSPDLFDGNDIDGMFRVGAGATLEFLYQTFFGLEVSYINVGGDSSLIETVVVFGVGF